MPVRMRNQRHSRRYQTRADWPQALASKYSPVCESIACSVRNSWRGVSACCSKQRCCKAATANQHLQNCMALYLAYAALQLASVKISHKMVLY